jgi:hypothetical protein
MAQSLSYALPAQVVIQMQETMAMQQQLPDATTNEFRIRAYTTYEVSRASWPCWSSYA